MRVLIIAILFSLALGEKQKRRLLKGATTCYDGEYKVTVKEGDTEISYCVKCSDNCADKCVENEGCKQCKDATFSDGNGGCDPCMLGCQECENARECKTCNSTIAYKMGDNCYLKPVQCAEAQDQKGCVKCKDNYFLTNVTNGNCTACSVDGLGCAENQCDPTTTEGCRKVADTGRDPSTGYYISGGTAWKCDENCELCYEKSRDQSIYNGKGVTPGAENGCHKCKTGYFWFESAAGDMKFCKKCSVQCKTCETTEYNCASCEDGYVKHYAYKNSNGTNFYSCRLKDEKCDKYKDNGNCEKCKDGYVLDATEYCVPIHPMFTETTDKKQQCGPDFAYVDGTCRPKSENCAEYDDDNKCKKCVGLTYLSGGFCLPCHEKCVDCNHDNGICIHCQPDYYSNGTSTCYPDFTSLEVGANEKLWAIGTNEQPIRCVDGKYVDFANMTRDCKTCSQYCLEEIIPLEGENATAIKIDYCDSAVGCLRCKEGFYVSPNGECSSCSPHCALCDQTLGCLHCLGETVMVDGRCEYSGATSILTLLIVLILALIL